MVSARPDLKTASLDRLDFGWLRRLWADLGLQTSYWASDAAEIKGLSPENPLCRCVHNTGRHCQPFLLRLARDAQADPDVHCRSCMPGAFTLAVRLDGAPGHNTPVALGCFVTAALAVSQEARDRLRDLQVEPENLLGSLLERGRYRPDDLHWLTTAFDRIAREWYARSCDQVREVEALSQGLADTYEELSVIYRLNEAMNLTASPRAYLQNLAEELRDLLDADAVLIRLSPQTLPADGGEPFGVICAGGAIAPVDRLLANLDVDKLARRGHQVVTLGKGSVPADAATEAVAHVLATPILRNGEHLGVIAAVWAASRHKVNNIDVTRISSIAKSTAMVLENFRLYENLRQLFVGTLRALTRSIDAKDPYTCGHSERVANLGRRLALRIGCTPQQAERIYLCGLLHDIGKIGIPEAVLQKPGRLTDEEFAQVKRHPTVGAAILDGIDELDDIIPGVLHHHERMDGRGYPGGLVGQDIPLYARILAVADSFDAMTSPRPYREVLSIRAVVNEFKHHTGTQFDPVVSAALLQHDLAMLVEELGRSQSAEPSVRPEPALSGRGNGR
jgi:hypothetical protein